MKMKRILSVLLSVMILLSAVLLTGCGEDVDYREHLDDYVKTLDYHDGFHILQLTDIHWNNSTDLETERAYIEALIAEAKSHAGGIDLIEITGDTFMLADGPEITAFIEMMDGIGIPYAMLWGNHDREGTYNPNKLSQRFEEAANSLYTEIDRDNVNGRCNYVINLKNGDDTVWQIVNLDSGASYRKGATDLNTTYDYIRDNQLEWMKAEHDAVGEDVPVLCYYHIAQAEVGKQFEDINNGVAGYKAKFFKQEGTGASKYASDVYDTFKSMNVKGVFMGHCHSNDYSYSTPDGILYGFGVKTGAELYFDSADTAMDNVGFTVPESFDVIGASLVTIKNAGGDIELEHLYFNVREEGNFVLWVNFND